MSDDPLKLGRDADRLLADETFLRAIQWLEQRYILDWRNANTLEAREACHARISVIADLQTELRKMADTGHFEAAARKRRGA
jgi:hypothetical protein